MKVSISLPEADLHFLDEYAKDLGGASRSAVILRAIRLLRARELGPSYSNAWEDWEVNEEAELWDATAGDGVSSASSPGEHKSRSSDES